MLELAAIVWTVLNITIFPDGPAPYEGVDAVVKDVYWEACVEQEIDGTSYRVCEEGGTTLAPVRVDPSDEYPDPDTFQYLVPDPPATALTEEMVLGWVHARMPEEQLAKTQNVLLNNLEIQVGVSIRQETPSVGLLPWAVMSRVYNSLSSPPLFDVVRYLYEVADG